MFEIKSFSAFTKSIKLNEALGSNVWKFDADRPGPGEGGKFSFKAKVQYTESSQSEAAVANQIADFLSQKLATEADFKKILADSNYVPVIDADRNTRGGFFTGGRGVLTGSIIFLDRKFYNDSALAGLPGFKPLGVGKEIVIDGKKIYDAEKIDAAKEDRSKGRRPVEDTTQTTTAAPTQSSTETTTVAPVQAAAAPAAAPAAITAADTKPLTDMVVGSKQADKNYKIETLQGLLNQVPANSANQITVDGNYGTRTGGAIARAIGMAEPIKPILAIDQATADKLAEVFSKIAGIKIADLIAAAKKEGVPAAAMQYAPKKTGAKKTAVMPKSRKSVD
jgi:hypothetical protein